MLKRVFFYIKIFFLYILTGILGLVVPKDKKLTVCVSSKGKYYNGNSKALFEYMLSRDKKVFFFVSNKELYRELKEKKIKNIIYQYSLEGFKIFLRARTICFTHGQVDLLGYMQSPLQNWIYLAHGIGTKALGFLREDMSLKEKFWVFLERRFYITMTSDFTKYMYISEMLINPKKVFVTGFSRNDVLYANRDKQENKLNTILYAPTCKEGDLTKLFPFPDFKKESIGNDLQKWDMELYLRFHPNNYKESRKEITDILKSSKRIIDKSPDIVQDVQDILPETDILVTDFSSISRDFLFLDRPIIFIMNGLEELGNLALPIRKEFAFCGYQVYTYKEFSDAIEEILEGKDRYSEIRSFVRDLHYNYVDANSSKRIMELIEMLA